MDMDDSFRVFCDIGIMGYHDDCDAVVIVELLEHAQDFLACMGIKISGRFIREKEGRPVYQRPCDRHA